MPKFLLNAKIKKCSRFTGEKKKWNSTLRIHPLHFPALLSTTAPLQLE